MRVLRDPHREEAEPARRCRGDRELRDRGSRRLVRPGDGHRRRSAPGRRDGRLPRRARRRPGRSVVHAAAARAPGRGRDPERSTRRPCHGAPAAGRRLGMAGARALDARRVVGWLAVPSRGSPQRAPRGRDDGHAHLDRHVGRLVVVGGRAAGHRRRGHVLRGRSGDHDPDPARPLPRGARAKPLG